MVPPQLVSGRSSKCEVLFEEYHVQFRQLNCHLEVDIYGASVSRVWVQWGVAKRNEPDWLKRTVKVFWAEQEVELKVQPGSSHVSMIHMCIKWYIKIYTYIYVIYMQYIPYSLLIQYIYSCSLLIWLQFQASAGNFIQKITKKVFNQALYSFQNEIAI